MKTFESPVGIGDSIYYIQKIGYDKFIVRQGVINKVSFTKSTTSFGIKGERNLFVLGSRASLDATELKLIAEAYNKKLVYEHNNIKAISLDLCKEYLDSEIRLCLYRDSINNEEVSFKTELKLENGNMHLIIYLAHLNINTNIGKIRLAKLKKLTKGSKFSKISKTDIKILE